MATFFQNLELGAAGVADEVAGTHLAAKVFAQQESDATGGDVEELTQQAITAEDQGQLDAAARATGQGIENLGEGLVDKALGALGAFTILGLVVVGGALFLAVKYRKDLIRVLEIGAGARP